MISVLVVKSGKFCSKITTKGDVRLKGGYVMWGSMTLHYRASGLMDFKWISSKAICKILKFRTTLDAIVRQRVQKFEIRNSGLDDIRWMVWSNYKLRKLEHGWYEWYGWTRIEFPFCFATFAMWNFILFHRVNVA